jgi:hypothetical protein
MDIKCVYCEGIEVIRMEKCWFFGVFIVVGYGCFLGDIVGVEGYPNEDLIMKLPGQPKVEFSQYAGYVDIDVKYGRVSSTILLRLTNTMIKSPSHFGSMEVIIN